MGRKTRNPNNKRWRNQYDIDPTEFGLPERKSALDEIEDTPISKITAKAEVDREQNKIEDIHVVSSTLTSRLKTKRIQEDSDIESPEFAQTIQSNFQNRIKVSNTPTVRKVINNVADYPENAIIISIGPTSAGKTTFLNKIFNRDSVYSYTSMQFLGNTEEERNMYIDAIEMDSLGKDGGHIVVDSSFLDEDFRARIYEISKKSGRPIFILTHVVMYEECLKRIEEKYSDPLYKAKMKHNPLAERKEESLQKLRDSYEKFLEVIPGLDEEIERYNVNLQGYDQVTYVVQNTIKSNAISRPNSGR